jgi:hypothetical protein
MKLLLSEKRRRDAYTQAYRKKELNKDALLHYMKNVGGFPMSTKVADFKDFG